MSDLVLATLAHAVLPCVDVPPVTPPGAEKFLQVAGMVRWGATIVCIVGFLIAGAKLALSSRTGEGAEHGKALGLVMVGCVIVGVAAQFASSLIGI